MTIETRKGHQIPWSPLMWVLGAGLGSWGRAASPSQQSTQPFSTVLTVMAVLFC